MQEVDLVDVLNSCRDECFSEAAAKRVQMSDFLVTTLPLLSDKESLYILFRNLIDNAVSHCDEDGRVSVSATTNGSHVTTTIENTGNKLPADQVSSVIDRFWQGDGARTQTGRHSGLGLPLVEKIIDDLNGELRVQVSGPVFRVVVKLPNNMDRSLSATTT